MMSFADWLRYYNNLDVGPFIEALQKMKKILWRTRNIYMQRCCELARCFIAVSAQRDRQQVKKQAVYTR